VAPLHVELLDVVGDGRGDRQRDLDHHVERVHARHRIAFGLILGLGQHLLRFRGVARPLPERVVRHLREIGRGDVELLRERAELGPDGEQEAHEDRSAETDEERRALLHDAETTLEGELAAP
jgi:hypothetical protein